MEIISQKISSEDILGLIPSVDSIIETQDEKWKSGLRLNGWEMIYEPFESLVNNPDLNIGNLVELPPLLRIGKLQVEKEFGKKKNFKLVHEYLEKKNYPALISLRDSPAILLKSKKVDSKLLDIYQGALITLMANLDPSVIRVTVIDSENFGSRFQFINSSVPSPDIISEPENLREFIKRLPEDLKSRNQTRGLSFQYLYEFNKQNRDSSIPYHFIIIGSYEKDIDEDSKKLIKKIIANSNATKAGIYFIVNTESDTGYKDFLSIDKSIPQLIEKEIIDDLVSFELRDPKGLDTSETGKQSCLEIYNDVSGVRKIEEMSKYCLNHLRKRNPEPVKFELPAQDDIRLKTWKGSTIYGIDVPIGKSRGNQVNLRLGNPETVYNALIGGAVGTGKTILLHGIILQSMVKYSPQELKLSLLDYKDGTEFNIYKKIPHLYALSIGAGTKFGVDLLQHFQNEIVNRAKVFKEVGASDLQSYREKSGKAMPRHLIIIDEFQVLMNTADTAKNALEDLIRRGRSYGLTFILSSQSLKDGSLTTATKNNLGTRICLRVSESDCADFLSVNNIIPTKFKDAGQAVYNNQEGIPNGNLEFRCAYYKNSEITDFIDIISELEEKNDTPYLYDDSLELNHHELDLYAKPGSIIFGLEEGIPNVPHFIDFSTNKEAIIIVGIGNAKKLILDRIMNELAKTNIKPIQIDSSDLLSGGCENIKSLIQIQEMPIVIVNIKAKDSNNYDFRNTLENLLADEIGKYLLIAEHPNDISNYKDRVDQTICADQRSFKSLVFSRSSVITNTVAVINQHNPDGVIVKIPK